MKILIKPGEIVYCQSGNNIEEEPMRKNCPSHGRSLLKKQLVKESSMVADDSMSVLEEFEVFEEGSSLKEVGEENHGGKGHG